MAVSYANDDRFGGLLNIADECVGCLAMLNAGFSTSYPNYPKRAQSEASEAGMTLDRKVGSSLFLKSAHIEGNQTIPERGARPTRVE